MWWLDLNLDSKEWLRENLRAEEFPLEVLQGIAEAGALRVRLERYQGVIASPFNRVGREPGNQ